MNMYALALVLFSLIASSHANPGNCKDMKTHCDYWKGKGYCSVTGGFYDFMKINCPKTCKFSCEKALRCTGENSDCCTEANPCVAQEGDCDKHSECKGNLTCGNNNCLWGGQDDCCYEHKALRCKGENDGCCTEANPCEENDGDCDSDKECKGDMKCGSHNCGWGGYDDCCYEAKGLRCKGINDGCCTATDPCDVNDGDCDNDNECEGDLKCGKNNCGWRGYDDCCYSTEDLRCKGINDGCCTEANPCDENDGDCDSDKECKGDMQCGSNNCDWGGNDDCCYSMKDQATEEAEQNKFMTILKTKFGDYIQQHGPQVVFNQIDADGSGSINAAELKGAVVDVTDNQVALAIKLFDTINKNGEVEFNEFAAAISALG